jgi:hypothetical protein
MALIAIKNATVGAKWPFWGGWSMPALEKAGVVPVPEDIEDENRFALGSVVERNA